jgi:hypothetical protein
MTSVSALRSELPRLADICRPEKRLAALPVVTVLAITLEGDSNGAIHAPSTAYRNKFSGKYDYRLITGGVGHNIPQEAPQAFAQAVIDVDRL